MLYCIFANIPLNLTQCTFNSLMSHHTDSENHRFDVCTGNDLLNRRDFTLSLPLLHLVLGLMLVLSMKWDVNLLPLVFSLVCTPTNQPLPCRWFAHDVTPLCCYDNNYSQRAGNDFSTLRALGQTLKMLCFSLRLLKLINLTLVVFSVNLLEWLTCVKWMTVTLTLRGTTMLRYVSGS